MRDSRQAIRVPEILYSNSQPRASNAISAHEEDNVHSDCMKPPGPTLTTSGQLAPYVSLYQIDLKATGPGSSCHGPSPTPGLPKKASTPEAAERHPKSGKTKLPDLESRKDGSRQKKRPRRRFNPPTLRKLAPAPPRPRPNLYQSPCPIGLPVIHPAVNHHVQPPTTKRRKRKLPNSNIKTEYLQGFNVEDELAALSTECMQQTSGNWPSAASSPWANLPTQTANAVDSTNRAGLPLGYIPQNIYPSGLLGPVLSHNETDNYPKYQPNYFI